MDELQAFRLQPGVAKSSQNTGQIMCRIHETSAAPTTEQETRGRNEMRKLALSCLRATRLWGWTARTERHIRRIAHDEVGGSAIFFCNFQNVFFDQTRLFFDFVFAQIFGAKTRRLVVDLDERDVRRRSRAQHRDADRARSRTEIERSARDFFRARKARQMERVDVRAISRAAFGLKRKKQKRLIFARDDDRGTKVR
jgi:hypothetical protein